MSTQRALAPYTALTLTLVLTSVFLAGCLDPGIPAGPCPTDLAVALQSNGDVLVTWTPAPGSNGTNIWRSVNGGEFDLGDHVDGNTTNESTDDTPHTPGWTYTYTARGTYGFNESQDCPEASVTIPGGTSPPPTDIPFFPSTTSVVVASLAALVGVGFVLRRRS